MRRLLLVVVAGALSAGAALLPAPPAPPPPDLPVAAVIGDIAGAQRSVWYCPWMSAGAERDSYLMLAAARSLEVEVTLPSPIPNEEADQARLTLADEGAEALEVASIVRRGDAPGFAEFDNGPAAASALVVADTVLAGDRCTGAVPKLWHLPGGTTQPERTTTLRLFNPFPEPAKVSVGGFSEFGEVGLVGLTSIDVAGRSWQDINLNEIVPLLDDLALTVSSQEGLVIPSLVVAAAGDEATWPGVGLSTTWEFPVVRQTGLVPSLVISNPGDVEAGIEIDVFTEDGAVTAARTAKVPAGRPVRIAIDDLAGRFFGVRLRSTAPIAAVVVAEDVVPDVGEDEGDETAALASTRIAGTVGSTEPVRRWLLAGPGGLSTATSTMWLLNSHIEPVTISLQPLGSGAHPADKIRVEAGTVRRIVLSQQTSVAGYLLEAATPFSAAWSIESGAGAAFVAGVSVDE